MKIYVITKGSYSDYHICAVATDEAKAKKLAEIYTDRFDDAGVEEYDTDSTVEILNGRVPFEVFFDKKLNLQTTFGGADWPFSSFTPGVCERTSKSLGDYVVVWLYAPDEATAIKVAAEKAAEFLAQKEGLT